MGRKHTLPLQKTARWTSGSCGGWGDLSVTLSSMISRLKRTPWMPCSMPMPPLTHDGVLANNNAVRANDALAKLDLLIGDTTDQEQTAFNFRCQILAAGFKH